MTAGNRYTLRIVCVLCSLALHAARFACWAAEAPKGAYASRRPWLRPVSWVEGYLVADVASFEREVGRYAGTSACEKVALAEYLVEFMASDEKCDAAGYEWKPGTDDLSLPAGRAKWALELILGVKLPGIVDRNASPEYLKKLREEAHLAIEAYRQGIIASAADHEVSPAEFERLKGKYRQGIIALGVESVAWGEEFARLMRKYEAKIPAGSLAHTNAELAMDELLLEWPPIGRKYEDLASIIGVKGDPDEDGISYRFQQDSISMVMYTFILQDGVIRSVKKTTS